MYQNQTEIWQVNCLFSGLGICFVQCNAGAVAGRGCEHLHAPAAAPWELRAGQSRVICVDSGLPLSHPVLIPLRKLCCGTLQPYSSVHCFITNHPMSFFVISLVFFTRKVAVQFKGTLVQGNNRTGDRQCCSSEIVLAGLLLDNLIR